MDELNKAYNIEQRTGKAYNPREQGKVEKLNGTLATMMKKLMAQYGSKYYPYKFMIDYLLISKTRRWIDFLEYVVDVYNNTRHSSTHLLPFVVFHSRASNLYRMIKTVNNEEAPDNETRKQIMERVQCIRIKVQAKNRERQSIIAARMKKLWDSKNTVVSFCFLNLFTY